jgi:hypothetical protein
MHLPNTSVTCPWCATYYPARPTTTNCMNCGGILPKGISNQLGEKPSLPPRALPKKFINQVMLWKNTKAFIGVIFIVIGIPTIPLFGFGLIFTLVGYFLYKSGRKEGFEKITALQNGIAAEGEISEISYDTSETINGKHPYLVKYMFTTASGQPQADSVKSWDDNNALLKKGDKIWVVYIPENPQISSPWPPMV